MTVWDYSEIAMPNILIALMLATKVQLHGRVNTKIIVITPIVKPNALLNTWRVLQTMPMRHYVVFCRQHLIHIH